MKAAPDRPVPTSRKAAPASQRRLEPGATTPHLGDLGQDHPAPGHRHPDIEVRTTRREDDVEVVRNDTLGDMAADLLGALVIGSLVRLMIEDECSHRANEM